MFDQLKAWDREFFIYLNNLEIERFDGFWIFVTQPEHWIPLYLLMIFMIMRYFKLKNALVILGCYFLNFLVVFEFTRIVKNAVARARPNNNVALAKLIRVLQEPTNYSFFSGHTSTSVAITTFFVLAFRKRFKWVYLLYIWPLLFASSRIFVGVHYPSDLFVGALVGLGFGYAFHYFCLFLIQKRDKFRDKPIEHKF